MITKEAWQALAALEAAAERVCEEYEEHEDRTHIKPESLRQLREKLNAWNELEDIEA